MCDVATYNATHWIRGCGLVLGKGVQGGQGYGMHQGYKVTREMEVWKKETKLESKRARVENSVDGKLMWRRPGKNGRARY